MHLHGLDAESRRVTFVYFNVSVGTGISLYPDPVHVLQLVAEPTYQYSCRAAGGGSLTLTFKCLLTSLHSHRYSYLRHIFVIIEIHGIYNCIYTMYLYHSMIQVA